MTTAASTATGGCSNSPKIFDLEILQNNTNATRQELMIKGLESSMKSIRSLDASGTSVGTGRYRNSLRRRLDETPSHGSEIEQKRVST